MFYDSGCVWLSACLVIRSFDSYLDEYLLRNYNNDCNTYEWLNIHDRYINGIKHFYILFNNDILCYLQVGIIKPRQYYINNPIGYILSGITEGLFIGLHEDNCGVMNHTIEITI